MMRRAATAVLIVLALAACARRGELTPVPPETLPPAPFGSPDRPTAEDLLEPSPMAVVERSVELREESEEREDDPFDLPPE